MPFKLLHLDDDTRQTQLLTVLLRGTPYQVVSANNPQQALIIAHAEKPDAMLVDINMPYMNGVQFAERVKTEEALRHIPLIALTANAMYGDREYYLSRNFDAYLAKPVLRHELLQVLERYHLSDERTAKPPSPDDHGSTNDTSAASPRRSTT